MSNVQILTLTPNKIEFLFRKNFKHASRAKNSSTKKGRGKGKPKLILRNPNWVRREGSPNLVNIPQNRGGGILRPTLLQDSSLTYAGRQDSDHFDPRTSGTNAERTRQREGNPNLVN